MAMQKDFTAWHARKSTLNSLSERPYFYEREVWWVAIGHNIGDEEDGKGKKFARPVLVLRKFNRNLFYGVPLSTTKNRGPYHHPFNRQDGSLSVALLSQLRAYDTRRLLDKHGDISKEAYGALQAKLAAIINRPPR
jgi:mRNA interferase MazF